VLLKRLLQEPLFERVRRRAFQASKPAERESQKRPVTSE
jgi:hypothetical protein